MSLSTTRLYSRHHKHRHNRHNQMETTESEDRDEYDSQLERKLAAIRRSTRHLRDKLTAERDELERCRVKHAASFAAAAAATPHQYLPTAHSQISPLYNFGSVMDSYRWMAYQMSPWMAGYGYYPPMHPPQPASTTTCYPINAHNPYASMPNLHCMPFSPYWLNPNLNPYHNPFAPHTSYPSLFDAYYMKSLKEPGYNFHPSPSIIISDTYDQLDQVDKMCRAESKKLKKYRKKTQKLRDDLSDHDDNYKTNQYKQDDDLRDDFKVNF